jgi:hypothetical protein
VQLPPLPSATLHHCLAILDDGSLFITGGWNETLTSVREAHVYDGIAGSGVADMPTGRRGMSCGVVGGREVVVAGGHDDADEWLDTIEVFNADFGAVYTCSFAYESVYDLLLKVVSKLILL